MLYSDLASSDMSRTTLERPLDWIVLHVYARCFERLSFAHILLEYGQRRPPVHPCCVVLRDLHATLLPIALPWRFCVPMRSLPQSHGIPMIGLSWDSRWVSYGFPTDLSLCAQRSFTCRFQEPYRLFQAYNLSSIECPMSTPFLRDRP